MAPMEELPVFEGAVPKKCYYCGNESAHNKFKYYDNKKLNQPRFQCGHCKKFFTSGSHGRPQGKTYTKKRNEDPPELRGLRRDCRHCGVADNAPFKYYNNKSLLQPRFRCLSCGNQFQMRVLGDGHARRLVHTSSTVRQPRSGSKTPGLEPNSTSSNSNDERNLPDDDGLPVPVDSHATSVWVPCEPAEYAPQLDADDAQLWVPTEPVLIYTGLQHLDLTDCSLIDEQTKRLNSVEAGSRDEMNEDAAEKDADLGFSATHANVEVTRNEMVDSAPQGTLMDLMELGWMGESDAELLKRIEARSSNEVMEVAAVEDVHMGVADISADHDVAHDQTADSAMELFMDDPFAAMPVSPSSPFSFQQALVEDQQRSGCEWDEGTEEDMGIPLWS